MKIKTSFVTNSSSTSFMLASEFECAFRAKYNEEIASKFKLFPMLSKFKIKSNIYFIEGERDIPLDPDDGTPQLLKDCNEHTPLTHILKIKIYVRWGRDRNENDVVLLSIDIQNPASVKERDKSNKIISTMIAKEIKKILNCKLKTKAFYHQYISKFCGDGWDGGDPMGVYAFIMDAKKNETFVKTIYLVG